MRFTSLDVDAVATIRCPGDGCHSPAQLVLVPSSRVVMAVNQWHCSKLPHRTVVALILYTKLEFFFSVRFVCLCLCVMLQIKKTPASFEM